MNAHKLQERLIEFSVLLIKVTRKLTTCFASRHLAHQLIRSGTSPALQYGEACGAESRNDFIHKLSVVLKELRECHVNLRIIEKAELSNNQIDIEQVIEECNQLIAILVSSLNTLKGTTGKMNSGTKAENAKKS